MGKPFELVFFVAVMAWIGAVMISDTPRNRIEMICKPVEWGGRLAGSVASLGSDSAEGKTRSYFTDRTQDCKMLVFKQFYAESYRKLMEAKAEEDRKASEDRKAGGKTTGEARK